MEMPQRDLEVVAILWRDTQIHGSGPRDWDDKEIGKLIPSVSVGVLLHETEETISLCRDYFPTTDDVRGASSYAKALVERIIRLGTVSKETISAFVSEQELS